MKIKAILNKKIQTPLCPLACNRSRKTHKVNAHDSRMPGIMNPEQWTRNLKVFCGGDVHEETLPLSRPNFTTAWLQTWCCGSDLSLLVAGCCSESRILLFWGPRHAQGYPLILQCRLILPGWRALPQQHSRCPACMLASDIKVVQTPAGFLRKPDPPYKGSKANTHLLEKSLLTAKASRNSTKEFSPFQNSNARSLETTEQHSRKWCWASYPAALGLEQADGYREMGALDLQSQHCPALLLNWIPVREIFLLAQLKRQCLFHWIIVISITNTVFKDCLTQALSHILHSFQKII